MTPSFPVALKLEGRACLVVGGGREALRRVRALSEAGAEVYLVTPDPQPELRSECLNRRVKLFERSYLAHDMAGKWLAVLCDRDAALAARLGQDAEQQRVFFCAIDQPQNNSFSHVGLSRSGPLFIAVGTEGKAPALARRLKLEFERLLQEPTFSDFVAMLVRVRERTDPKQRKHELNRLASKLRLSGGFVIDE